MKRRQKKVQEFLSALKVGDRVVTSGGIYGVDHEGERTVRAAADRAERPGRSRPQRHRRLSGPGARRRRDEARNAHMAKNLRWKLLVIVGVIALAVFAFYPPQQKVRLGLDLKGGVHLVLRVQTDDARPARDRNDGGSAARAVEDRRHPRARTVTVASPTEFRVEDVPPDRTRVAARCSPTSSRPSTARPAPAATPSRCGRTSRSSCARRRSTQALQTIERRVNELGVAEPIVARHSGADQILVQLPGVTDVRAREGDHQVDGAARAEAGRAGTVHRRGRGARGVQQQRAAGPADPARHERRRRAGATARRPCITSCGASRRSPAAICATRGPRSTRTAGRRSSFSLNNDGAQRFGTFTAGQHQPLARHRARQPRLLGADASTSASTTRASSRATSRNQEAADLVAGAAVGRAAGDADLSRRAHGRVRRSAQDSIRAGVTASIGGLVFVMIFMLAYYKLAGINALVSIVVNLIILLGLMAYLGATMTLPGIAGFILTIGIGVDSNVLIFERIKEELQTAKGVKQAVAAGFDRVFLTILDTHVASLISAAFLFQFGTGPIRGFATTLTIGLLVERVHRGVRVAHDVRARPVPSPRRDNRASDLCASLPTSTSTGCAGAGMRWRCRGSIILAGVVPDGHARAAARHRLLRRHADRRALRAAGQRRSRARDRHSRRQDDPALRGAVRELDG